MTHSADSGLEGGESTKPPQYVRRALGLGMFVALICALGGQFGAMTVVGEIARVARHSEPLLRALGWCWTALPFVLLILVLAGRNQFSRSGKEVAGYALSVWFASSALLLPPRNGDLQGRLGDTYPDGDAPRVFRTAL